MLISDKYKISAKLHDFRKRMGMTQADVAEAAGISERTYAEIERGSVNMRMETLLAICKTLRITPNEILTDSTDAESEEKMTEIFDRLGKCTIQERETALGLLSVYLESISK